jgi:hypothetical protein
MTTALSASASVEAMDAAVAALLLDRYAANTHRSRLTWQKTWLKMHVAAHRHIHPPPPPFPLTPTILHRIAALFKAGGYLSYENYVIWAKSEHLATN